MIECHTGIDDTNGHIAAVPGGVSSHEVVTADVLDGHVRVRLGRGRVRNCLRDDADGSVRARVGQRDDLVDVHCLHVGQLGDRFRLGDGRDDAEVAELVIAIADGSALGGHRRRHGRATAGLGDNQQGNRLLVLGLGLGQQFAIMPGNARAAVLLRAEHRYGQHRNQQQHHNQSKLSHGFPQSYPL